jgi:DNA polymerase III delta prime subunit
LIAKIQENEMVNIKIFEVEKEFYDKERSLEAKINDLQKRILQLD